MTEAQPRKKSPRAPSMGLDEALDRALKAYDRERLHSAPTEVVAQNIGYKNANNGSALQALASLRYFGLLHRPVDGQLAVTKDVEAFKFAPDEQHRRALLIGFLKRPPLYEELLERFASGLPSDANLRYELIQRGFIPQAAEVAQAAFRRSVEFAGYFNGANAESSTPQTDQADAEVVDRQQESIPPSSPREEARRAPIAEQQGDDESFDRIPVRLPGGRRAWLVIPSVFHQADKARLKAQIDLLLTQDEEKSLGDN